ncbi:SdrD B-like domain-containing protein, partial [Neolewinella agarilytica]
MKHLVLQRQAYGLLLVFVVTLLSTFSLSAQENISEELLEQVQAQEVKLTVFEYTVMPESAPGLRDGYISFESNGSRGSFIEFSATVNGRSVSERLAIDSEGYAKLRTPDNAIYENVKISVPGGATLREGDVEVFPNALMFSKDNLPVTGEDNDLNYSGTPYEDAEELKSSGCSNNKLSNRGFESGSTGWWTNSGAYVVTYGTAGEYIYNGSRAMKLDVPGSYASQTFSIGSHREFCFSAYAKNHSSAGTYYAGVKFRRADGSQISETTQHVARNSGYNLYQFDGFTPAGTSSVEVFFYRDSHTNDNGWVDLVCFQDKGTVINGGTPPASFIADCGDGKTVDSYASDVDCSASPQAITNIPSSGNVYQVVVEVVYKGANPGQDTYVTASNGQNYLVSKANVQNVGNSSFHIYRGLIPTSVSSVTHTAATGQCTNNSRNNSGFQSLASFAFRNVTVEKAGSGIFTALTGYNSIAELDIPIPTSDLTRDVTLKIPFSEITLDGRYVTINAKVNGVQLATNTWTFGPAGGPCCIDILELPVPNVPGGASVITVEVDTRNVSNGGLQPVNGQSYTLAGLAYADVECPKDNGDCILAIRADGSCGHEQIQLRLNGVTVATYILSTSYQTFTYNDFTSGDDVEIHFVNDGNNGCDRNVKIDYIKAGDDIYQTSTTATATNTPCNSVSNEGLYCNGKFDYGKIYCCSLTSPGSITTGHFVTCVDEGETADPPTFVATAATCSSGTPQYQWQIKPEAGGSWTNIAGATSQNYNPGAFGVGSRWFRRRAKCDCETSFTQQTNVRDVHIRPNPVVNITSTNESCDGTEQGSITFNYQPEATGTYNVLRLSINGGTSFTDVTVNAAGSYTFSNLSTGTYIPRAHWEGTNCDKDFDDIVISQTEAPAVIAYCGDVQNSKVFQNSSASCNNQIARVFFASGLINGATAGNFWSVEGGSSFEEFNDGAARLQMTVRNTDNANLRMELDIVLNGRTQTAAAGSPKFGVCVSSDNADWYYYTEFTGSATGLSDLAGMKLSLMPMGTNLQVGTGAHLLNPADYGLSSWLSYEILSQPTGSVSVTAGVQMDINAKLNSNTPPKFGDDDDCGPICPYEQIQISAQGAGGLAPYTYSWNKGLGNGQVKNPGPLVTTTYRVTITDANGCTSTDDVRVLVKPYYDDGGEIAADQMGCSPYDANVLTSVSLPSSSNGATGAVEYLWLKSTGDCTPPEIGNMGDWVEIPNSNSTTLDPGTLTETTCFIRCARPVGDGCTYYLGESNVITITVSDPPTTNVTGEDNICVGSNSTLTASVSGGTAPFTYAWSNGAGSTQSVTVQPQTTTTYRVTVTDANNCTDTDQFTVTVRQLVDPGLIAGGGEECGQIDDANTFISNTQVPTGSGLTTRWRMRVFDATTGTYGPWTIVAGATGLTYDPGTITVTTQYRRQTQGDCRTDFQNTNTVTFTVNPEPDVTATNDIICAGEMGSITASATGGEAPYTYAWSNGGGNNASASFTPAATTTYTVTVTDANGCTDTATGTINVKPQPVAEITAVPTSICSGETVTFTATPFNAGSKPTFYTWDFGDNATPATATGAGPHVVTYTLPAAQNGNVNVTASLSVTNNGCEDSTTETITIKDNPEVTDVTFTNPTCGEDNGTITISYVDNPNRTGIAFSVDGGVTFPYGAADDAGSYTISDLDAGAYDLFVRWGDASCPVDIENVNLTDQNGPVVTASNDASICVGGSVTLSASATGGNGTVTYTWNQGAGAGAQVVVNPTTTTTYTVTATDANNCTSTDQVTVTVVPDPEVTITSNGTDICEGGAISFDSEVSGGLECRDVRWQIRPVGGSYATVANADTYTTATDLTPGDYQVRATYICDGEGCNNDNSNTITITVVEDPEVTLAINDNTLCIGETATLTATPSGGLDCDDVIIRFREGTSGTWTNVATGNTYAIPTDLAAGTYQYNARLTCSGTDCNADNSNTVTITVKPDPAATVSNQAICVGEPATLTATTTVGDAPFTFAWSNGGGTNASATFSPTATTDYTVTVTDANGCTTTATGRITVRPQPVADITVAPTTICTEESVTFTAAATVSGSAYTWNFGQYASPATATGAGPHIVTYTLPASQNGNATATASLTVTREGCEDSDTQVITIQDDPEVTEIDFTNPTCGEDNGTITISFVDNPDYTSIAFSIDGGATYPFSSGDNIGSYTISDLSAGSYDVFVRWGAADCPIDAGNVNLVDQNGPSVTASDDASICIGGSVTLSAVATGGNGTVTYTWNQGAGAGAEVVVSPSTTTTYTVTVTDANECSSTDQVTVTVVDDPEIFISSNGDNVCEGGTISFTSEVSGGLDCQDVRWFIRAGTSGTFGSFVSQGDGYTTAADLVPGTYQIRARYICSGEGCDDLNSNVVTINVVEDPEVTLEIADNTLCIGETALLTATPTGGLECTDVIIRFREGTSGPWTNVATGNSYNVPTNLAPGSYQYNARLTCNGTDCNADNSNTVTITVKPEPTGTIEDDVICNSEEGSLTVVPAVGDAPFTFAWSNGGGNAATAVFSPTTTTEYTVTITDANGCVGTATGSILVNQPVNSSISAPAAGCANEDISFAVESLTQGATYAWAFDGPATPATATGANVQVSYSGQGTFSVILTVTTAEGCTSTTPTSIEIREPITADAGEDMTICQGGTIVLDGTNSIGNSFAWTVISGDPTAIKGSNNSETIDVQPLFNTVFRLTVRDATGLCSASSDISVDIDVDQNPTAGAEVAEELYCAGSTFVLDGSSSEPPVTDPTATLNYIWYRGEPTDENFIGLGETLEQTATTTQVYTLLVSADAEMTTCTDTTTVLVNVVECAELGDFVFVDQDGDGQQGNPADEPGVDGVTVNLKDEDGNVIATTTTMNGGLYEFTDLFPGTYSVQFDLASSGFDAFTDPNSGNDATDSDADPGMNGMTQQVTLGPGDSNKTLDAGVVNTASLGDFVFLDDDADGQQDADEEGINGVTVNLLDEDGNVLESTITADNPDTGEPGYYEFDELTPGTPYVVEFIAPDGTTFSPVDAGDDTTDSDANRTTGQSGTIVLESGENNPTIDAGIYETASLGDYVWLDKNADGQQDADEEGINGVTVNLLVDGAVVATTTTVTNGGEDGFYEFTDLTPGVEYVVEFVAPDGFLASPQDEGDDATDSDADRTTGLSQTVVLGSNENNPTIDAGFYETASLGDFVFLDNDADGQQDADEEGVNGVTVNLLDEDGNVLESTVTVDNPDTGAPGYYEFDELTPGTPYIVEFVAPDGNEFSPEDEGDDATDSDANITTGQSDAVVLESGENNPTIDAGIYEEASLGDYVWLDKNADGQQDADEEGINDVTVNLLVDGAVVATTTTVTNGGEDG